MKKYSKKDNISYTLGTTITLELLNKDIKDVLNVYVHSNQVKNETLDKILNICNENNIEVIYSDKPFNILSNKDNCYIIGSFRKFSNPIEKNTNHIVLVNPSNEGNLGTIIRTCVGFNINNVAIIRPAVDVFSPKVVRASMGAIFNVNFEYYDSFDEYVNANKNNNLYPFLLQTDSCLSTAKIKEPYSLVFGNEATGLPNEFQKIGKPLKIYHTSNIDSLNLDNAVSIALYEFTKKDFINKKLK